jgi:hypothetical protein
MSLNYFQSMDLRRKAEFRILELLGHYTLRVAEAESITFWFYGEESNIYRLAAALKQHEFSILTINKTNIFLDEFLCIAQQKMTLSEDTLIELSTALTNLAEVYHCRYDGHEMEFSN